MARIPDSELERLKAEVSVQRLVEAAGIELKRDKAGQDKGSDRTDRTKGQVLPFASPATARHGIGVRS